MEELNILPQFQPMTLFRTMESLQWLIMSSDPQLSKLYTHSEVMHLQTIIDTVYVEDLSSGRMVAVPIKLMSSPVSLLLVEKWEIIGGKNTNAFANVPPILGFKRTITGIGMRYDSGKPLYMPYDKVREQFKKNSINEDALEQLIHAHLTKALDICYYERW